MLPWEHTLDLFSLTYFSQWEKKLLGAALIPSEVLIGLLATPLVWSSP